MNNLVEREHNSLFQIYKRLPIVIDRATGTRIFAQNGDEYLDMLGGIAVNVLGHSHPAIIDAIHKQADKYLHVSNYFYQEPQVELAELLNKQGFQRVYFCNSGAEANESALKLVRRWGNLNNKSKLIAFSGGFHGRTYGALSMMDKPHYKDKMGPFLQNIEILPFNDAKALEQKFDENVAGIILEFVQGEGGLSVVSSEFADMIMKLKNKYNFLVVADEVQAGMGRTGKFFACDNFDVEVDIVSLAKGIGGGLPLGALLAKEHLADVWEKGMQGTTFGGNSLSCAVGVAVMNELENGVIENVNTISKELHKVLDEAVDTFPDKVEKRRGLGLLCGLLLKFDAALLVAELVNQKVIANAASGTVLRLAPPLTLSYQDVSLFKEKLFKSLENIKLE